MGERPNSSRCRNELERRISARKIRRPRRFCPGVRGEICSLCCGEEREATVDCPLDCEFLREGRRHEKAPARNPAEFPNRDIQVPEKLLRANEHLLAFLSLTIF